MILNNNKIKHLLNIIKTVILGFVISGCSSNKKDLQQNINCNGYTFIDSSSSFDHLITVFEKDNRTYFVLSQKEFGDSNKDSLTKLEIGKCYSLQLNENDTLKFLKRIIEINIRAPDKPPTYWKINGKSTTFMIGDSLVVETYTSENIKKFSYKK